LCFRPSVIFSVVASARLVLRQIRWASIAGIAEKEQRLRRIDFGGAGRALVASGAALNSRSPLWRLISRSRFNGNALAVTSAPELGNHQGPSTNSSSSPAVMRLWCGCNMAAAAGEA
jgi:hypothetical protein